MSKEVHEDRAYLAKVKAELQAKGVPTQAELAFGDPATKSSAGCENGIATSSP